MKTIWKARTVSWREREKVATPHFAVVRHAERADATWHPDEWLQTAEGTKYPNDPPLSERGVSEAKIAGRQLVSCSGMQNSDSHDPHVVVSSPFMRCLQTAVEVCLTIGPSAVLLLDYSIGEVYGPDIFGECEPAQVLRPMRELHAYCQARGVKLRKPAVGQMPQWPEFISQARVRFLDRFLRYLRRSTVARRNFTLVMHADGVATALSAMPAMKCRHVEHVGYGGFFVAILPQAHRRISMTKRIPYLSNQPVASVIPHDSEQSDNDGLDGLDAVGSAAPCLSATSGWQVHVSSNVQLGPRVSEGLLKRISRWSHQTRISEKSIQRLLHCLPKETMKESMTARQTWGSSSAIPGELSPKAVDGSSTSMGWEKQISAQSNASGRFGVMSVTSMSRNSVTSALSGSCNSSISQSTYLFGGSETMMSSGSGLSSPKSPSSPENKEKAETLREWLTGLPSPKSGKTPRSPSCPDAAVSVLCSNQHQELLDAETKRPAGFLSLSGSRLMQRRREKNIEEL